MNDLPLISIILPTIGRPKGLKRCLDSINKLNYPSEKIEIIVIQDEPRMGVPKRMAEGIRRSTGQYIVYASNDMEFTPDCILNALKHKKALVAFNAGPILPDEGNICEHFIFRKNFLPQIGGELFCTEFHHVGVDNLLWEKCKIFNEAVWCREAIVNHYLYSRTGEPMDEVYLLAWDKQFVKEDRLLLAKKMKEMGREPKWLNAIRKITNQV